VIDTFVYSASSHLVQSTLFAGAAAVLTLAFRANRAQVDYCSSGIGREVSAG
jgi:hypothetical protein